MLQIPRSAFSTAIPHSSAVSWLEPCVPWDARLTQRLEVAFTVMMSTKTWVGSCIDESGSLNAATNRFGSRLAATMPRATLCSSRRPDANQQIERFNATAPFQTRIDVLEKQLRAERWKVVGPGFR